MNIDTVKCAQTYDTAQCSRTAGICKGVGLSQPQRRGCCRCARQQPHRRQHPSVQPGAPPQARHQRLHLCLQLLQAALVFEHDVGPPPVVIAAHPQLAHGEEVVVFGRIEIEHPQPFAALFAVCAELHPHAIADQGVFVLIDVQKGLGAEDVGDRLRRCHADRLVELEINPLIVTTDGNLKCLDAKVSFDSNALYRHPDIVELRDETEEDAKEIEASKHDLAYIALDGTIGCMVNGAGLAMATMDIIKLYGEFPANFLDVGGGASPERTAKAFKLVLSDANVKAILVNIFAGINRCDWVAEGVVQALEKSPVNVPVIVRLAGTHVEEGRRILARSGLPVIRANTLAEAAERAVAAWKNNANTVGLKVVNA